MAQAKPGRHYPLRLKNGLVMRAARHEDDSERLALIPWRINFDDVVLPAAELGFVGTLPAFRLRGGYGVRFFPGWIHGSIPIIRPWTAEGECVSTYWGGCGGRHTVWKQNHWHSTGSAIIVYIGG